MTLKRFPLLRILTFYALGIAIAYHFDIDIFLTSFIFGLSVSFWLAVNLFAKRLHLLQKIKLNGLAIFLFSFGLGIIATQIFLNKKLPK